MSMQWPVRLLLAACGFLGACSPEAEREPVQDTTVNAAVDSGVVEASPPATESVRGVVVNDLGAPIRRFRVQVERTGEGQGGADTQPSPPYQGEDVRRSLWSIDGRFEFADLPAGSYLVTASAKSHGDDSLEVDLPGDAAELRFVLERHARIAGTVVAPDGTPAEGAAVRLSQEGVEWATETGHTDARGKFRLRSVLAGRYLLSAAKEELASSELLALDLPPGATADDLRLELAEREGIRWLGRITGVVLPSRSGEELEGRTVSALRPGRRETVTTTTDAAGAFALELLEPGEYEVSVGPHPSEVERLTTAEEGDAWHWYQALELRTRVQIEPGRTTELSFGSDQTGVVIEGTVHRARQPVAGLRLTCCVTSGADQVPKHARTDAEGRFELVVDGPGTYELEFQAPSGGTTITRSLGVPATGATGLAIELSSGRVAGRALRPDGADAGPTRASLAYLDGRMPQGSVHPSSPVSHGPDFEFTGLPGGRYLLALRAQGSAGGDVWVESRELELGEGQSLGGLELALARAGFLRVQIAGATEGWIEVRRVDHPEGTPMGWPFEAGACERDDLEAGTYELTAKTASGTCSSPQRVVVASGELAQATLQVHPGGTIELEILDAQGEPAALTAQIYDEHGRAAAAWAMRHGQTVLVDPGTYRVVVRLASGESLESSAEARPGETSKVTLRVP